MLVALLTCHWGMVINSRRACTARVTVVVLCVCVSVCVCVCVCAHAYLAIHLRCAARHKTRTIARSAHRGGRTNSGFGLAPN